MNCLQTFVRFCVLSCPRCISKLNSFSLAQNSASKKNSWRLFSGRSYSVYSLKSRGILQLCGPDTVPFLQGLVTNQIMELEERKVQYNMLLNVQGRVMYDLLLYHVSTSEGASILMECERGIADKLIADIKRFKIRKKVDIEDKSEKLNVLAAFTDGDSIPDISGVVIKNKDPRVPAFGERIIVDSKTAGNFSVITEEAGYHERRYDWGIPEGTLDLPPGNCFPLESNLVYMNGVCFTKGCYLGQELTARTHHTGVTRKRLMPLKFDSDPAEIEPGENIKNNEGKNVGKFRNRVGLNGLGLLRTADITGVLNVTNKLGQAITVSAHVPSWWPAGS